MSDVEELEHQNDNDDIDLREIFRDIARTKNWLILVVFVSSILFWLLAVIWNVSKPSVHSYELRLDFTFGGASEQEYPDGTPFSIGDLISPFVLTSVYENNGLQAYISRSDFVDGFFVAPYTPDQDLIIEKYKRQLSRTTITPAEIGILQDQMKLELNKASATSALLGFASIKVPDVPGALLRKAIRDVPLTWSDHMINSIGVLEYETEIYTSRVLDKAIFDKSDYLIAFEMVLDRISLLEKNVVALQELPNGVKVVDDVSGVSLPDLQRAISDVKLYRVAPLINPVRSLGLAKDPEIVRLYFENTLIDLQREIKVLREKKTNVFEAINSYSLQKGESSHSGEGQAGSRVSPQLSGEFLDRIVALTNSGADLEYRQDLNKTLLEISDDVAVSDSEVQRITRILQSMDGQNSKTQILRENYSSRVDAEMPDVLDQMEVFFEISIRMHDKLSRENLGSGGLLYKLADGVLTRKVEGNILSKSNLNFFAMFLFVLVVVTVPILMFLRAVRDR